MPDPKLSKYTELSNLMGSRSAGLAAHAASLKAEMAEHNGSHAYGRHGFQISWQAQLVRCTTQVSPDQVFDPSGAGAVIRRWNALSYKDRMLDASGAAIATDLIGPFNPELTDYKTVAGIMSGGFLGPEQQEDVRAAAMALAGSMTGPNFAGVEYKFMQGAPVLLRVPFTAFCYGVHGRFFGMGYKRKPGFVAVTHDFVLKCIAAFEDRTTLMTFQPSIPASVARLGYMTGPNRDKSLAFPQIGDLLDFLQVETFEQKAVRVVMRRPYDSATRTFGLWRVITMFPDNSIISTGFHPGRPFFTPEMKAQMNKMKQKKYPPTNIKKYGHLNFNKDLYDWTGRTCDIAMTTYASHAIPAWS